VKVCVPIVIQLKLTKGNPEGLTKTRDSFTTQSSFEV